MFALCHFNSACAIFAIDSVSKLLGVRTQKSSWVVATLICTRQVTVGRKVPAAIPSVPEGEGQRGHYGMPAAGNCTMYLLVGLGKS